MTRPDSTICLMRSLGTPEKCQGTDAGGNCRMMRDVPWKKRTCGFNSEVWRESPEGQADWDAKMEAASAVMRGWAKQGRCYNCGGTDDEHHEDGSCPTGDEIQMGWRRGDAA